MSQLAFTTGLYAAIAEGEDIAVRHSPYHLHWVVVYLLAFYDGVGMVTDVVVARHNRRLFKYNPRVPTTVVFFVIAVGCLHLLVFYVDGTTSKVVECFAYSGSDACML
ncbi:glucose-6-phosphate translocase-like [Tropilaelaps mercedesae]|uniref:Glucose-6-phosphate translocase-like n=1 Tax=Tropilaelaps mercedesae TaxID=418985 RepID=A0A1V9XZD7_9ACAR|nr:glucose-6-phosphate translocase-like [Tropilaelaps mercedesae]